VVKKNQEVGIKKQEIKIKKNRLQITDYRSRNNNEEVIVLKEVKGTR